MSAEEQKERFVRAMERFICLCARRLPDDALRRLEEMRDAADDETQRAIYDAYFENLKMAIELDRPSCQDTGLPHFYVTAGSESPHLGIVEECLREAVRRASASSPLRPNAVDWFDERNTGDDIGERMPWIHWDIAPGRTDIEILTYLSGAGCSLPGRSRVFKPSDGYPAVARYVIETVAEMGMNACPPLTVGVGLAHSAENAAALSKKACLRPFGTSHRHPKGSMLERELLSAINGLGIGAQGLAGNAVANAVHIESSARHTATFGVGVSVSCYMHRRGVIIFDKDMGYSIPTHEGARL